MSFRLDKFTIKAQEAVQRAQSLAQEKGHPEIDSLHLLAALLQESDGIVLPILQKIGVHRSQLDKTLQAELMRYPRSPVRPRRVWEKNWPRFCRMPSAKPIR